MLGMTVNLQGEGAWPDLDRHIRTRIEPAPDQTIGVAVLDKGMASGRPSVAIRIDTADGSVLIAQTSARLFCAAAKAIMAKYPALFEGE